MREHNPCVRKLLCDLDGTFINGAEDIRRASKIGWYQKDYRPLSDTKLKSSITSGQSALMAGS